MGAPKGNKFAVGKGRPDLYNEEIAAKICEDIATSSRSLRTICAQEGYPSVGTILKWLNTNESFLASYTRAKQEQADYLIEEMIDIADDGSNDLMTVVKGDTSYEMENKEVTNRSKLRVETRKWIASKLKPKKYGDKLEIDAKVQNTNIDLSNLSDEELTQLLDLQEKVSGTDKAQ